MHRVKRRFLQAQSQRCVVADASFFALFGDGLGKPDGPAAKLENEKEPGQTVAYEEIVKRWQQ